MNFLLHLEEKGPSKAILRNDQWIIEHLSINTNLDNPQNVETFILKHKGKDTYQAHLARIYKWYCDYKGIEWKLPKFSKSTQEIRCPTHEKIEMIIADSGKTLALKLKVSLATGLRPVELYNLSVKDIDTQQNIVYPHNRQTWRAEKTQNNTHSQH